MLFLTLSITITSLRPPPCHVNTSRTCSTPHGIQIAVLYLGFYLFAIRNGGIKPNVSTLGVDQFDEGDPNEQKHMSHFFNRFYSIISIGSLFSVTKFVYIQVTANYKVLILLQLAILGVVLSHSCINSIYLDAIKKWISPTSWGVLIFKMLETI